VTANVVGDTVAEDLATETFRVALGDAVDSAGRAVLVGDVLPGRVNDDDVAAPPVDPVTVDAGADAGGVEGGAIAIGGSASGGAGPLTTTWSVDDPHCTIADPAAAATTVTCTDDASAQLTLTATDGTTTASDTAALTVTNAVPAVSIDAPAPGTSVTAGGTVQLQTTVSDPGASDTVTCTVDWGDGSGPEPGCTGSHRFDAVGSYTIAVTATDDDGGIAHAATDLVVENVSTGNAFVFGGGTLEGGVTVGALVVPLWWHTKVGTISGAYTDARGRHTFVGGPSVNDFRLSGSTASWGTSGVLDGRRGASMSIAVTDGRGATPDHVQLVVTAPNGSVVVDVDADVTVGGFVVRASR
jgi:hypothetical protein